MTFEQILDAIQMLASSQGFYGRLYEAICDLDNDKRTELKNSLEAQNFSDTVDMILYFEA